MVQVPYRELYERRYRTLNRRFSFKKWLIRYFHLEKTVILIEDCAFCGKEWKVKIKAERMGLGLQVFCKTCCEEHKLPIDWWKIPENDTRGYVTSNEIWYEVGDLKCMKCNKVIKKNYFCDKFIFDGWRAICDECSEKDREEYERRMEYCNKCNHKDGCYGSFMGIQIIGYRVEIPAFTIR